VTSSLVPCGNLLEQTGILASIVDVLREQYGVVLDQLLQDLRQGVGVYRISHVYDCLFEVIHAWIISSLSRLIALLFVRESSPFDVCTVEL